MKFTDLNLDEQLLEALSYMNFVEATPIQEQAIPIILNKEDLIACAQTGTGKTGAFLLPILNKIITSGSTECNTLIVVPTRELAIQIDQQIQGFSFFLDVHSICIYGGGDGKDFAQEKKALTGGTNIIVATPGKLISHLNMGYVKFDKVEHLILDEADRMLDMGFVEDLQKIITYLPKERQNLMFSATMPPKIRTFMRTFLKDPKEISIAISKPAAGVLQAAYAVYEEQKIALINSLLKGKENYKSVIIFSSTKKKVSEILRGLQRAKYSAEAMSSDFEQSKREEVLLKFKSKQIQILVATDVISRGIDIKDINLVINYDVPGDAEDYVHRIGRTARANTTGVALTLVTPDDMYKFSKIEELIETEVAKAPMPAEIGKAPEWSKGKPQRKGHFKKRR